MTSSVVASPQKLATYRMLLVLAALAVHAVSLFCDRVLDNIDLRTHFQWAVQVQEAMADGTLYPRWMPRANGGLGEPAFVIIHPGWYWVVAGFHSLGLDTWWSMRVAAAASTLLAGFAVFEGLRRQMSAGAALTSALLIQAAPFGVFLFGFHAALPWHFSLALAVIVVLSSVNERRCGPILAAAVGLLSVTHLLVTFMVLLCIGAVFVVQALWQRRFAFFGQWALTVLLGLGCGAVYWLLAATSTPLFNPATRGDDLYLNWRNSFVWPFVTSHLFGTRWALAQWVLPLIPLALLVAAALFMAGTPKAQRDSRWRRAALLAAIAGVALTLGSELAYPAYAFVGFLTNVQWPYRFVTVASLAAPLSLGLAMAPHWPRRGLDRRQLALIAAAGVSVLLAAALLFKQSREGTAQVVGPGMVAGIFGQPGALPVGVGPNWRAYVEQGGLDAECARVGWQCKEAVSQSHRADYELAGDKAARLRLSRFAFPAWRVLLDGQPTNAVQDPDTGLLALDLPAGHHRVTVQWEPLRQERVGFAISMLSIAVLALWAAGSVLRERRG